MMHEESIELRLAHPEDFPKVWEILREAANWMMAGGRDQWDDKYPTAESVWNDITHDNGWVIKQSGQVVAYCAIATQGEPAYDALDGEWITAGPYAVVHRMAIALSHRGLGHAKRFFAHAECLARRQGMVGVRVDTNHDNREMLSLIASRNYVRTGRVWYLHGGRQVERIAFELAL